ncbi:MAG: hypothetical protein AB7H77_02690 [Bdellovibrionales bacterium]
MTNKLPLCTIALLLSLSATAFAEESAKTSHKVKIDDDGGYSESRSMTDEDAAGTVTKRDDSLKVEQDDDGSMERRIESKTSTDPKGLFNKETKKTIDKTTVDDEGKRKHTRKTTVNGKTVEDSEDQNGQP